MQKIDLSILPQGGINPIIRCSQGDIGRQFQVQLYDEDMSATYSLDGTETLSIEGHKPDGNFFQYDLPSQSGNIITISTEEQMTACYGDVYCELRITKGTTILGTANFTLQVEIGASAQDTVSISALQFVDALRQEMEEAVEDSEDFASDSKAWAVGPNGSGTGTDTNNSKYYSQQSANSATNSANSATASANSATDSKNWAVGPSGSGSATDSNNAKYWAGQASDLADDARRDKDVAVSAATASANYATNSKNWAVGPSGGGSGTDSNNAKYYAGQASQSASDANSAKSDAVDAKNDAVSAKNGAVQAKTDAEAAQQAIEDMTASASSLPEGSSPTVTKTTVGGVVNLGFGIPKGDTGDAGIDGSSFWTTTASPSTSGGGYNWNISDLSGDPGKTPKIGDIVFQGVYRYTIDSLTSTTVHCTVRQSLKGNTGTAATIAVGSVTTGEPGTPATVTNSGTTSAAVFDFSIPKGEKGDTGNTGPQGPNGVNKVYVGTCSTGASQAEKAVVIPAGQGFTLDTGAMIALKFTNSNTASSVQLNVNSTTAKSIYYANAVYTGSDEKVCGKADTYVYYVYDGTNWVWIGCGEASSGGGGIDLSVIASEFDSTPHTNPKTYTKNSLVQHNGVGYRCSNNDGTTSEPPSADWTTLTTDTVAAWGGNVDYEHCAADSNGDLWQNIGGYPNAYFTPQSPDTSKFRKCETWIASETTYTEYAVGDYCTYNDSLYKCTSPTTGQAWDSAGWDETDIGTELESIATEVANMGHTSDRLFASATISGNTVSATIDASATSNLVLGYTPVLKLPCDYSDSGSVYVRPENYYCKVVDEQYGYDYAMPGYHITDCIYLAKKGGLSGTKVLADYTYKVPNTIANYVYLLLIYSIANDTVTIQTATLVTPS